MTTSAITPGRAFAAAAIVVASTLAGSVAHSYFLAPAGSGSGRGTTSAFEGVTVSAEVAPDDSGLLLPGRAGDVVLTISNGNAFPVLVSVRRSVAAVTTSVEVCDPDLLAVAEDLDDKFATELALPIGPIATNEPATIRLAGAVTLDANAPDACQGASFTIPVTVTAEVTR